MTDILGLRLQGLLFLGLLDSRLDEGRNGGDEVEEGEVGGGVQRRLLRGERGNFLGDLHFLH